MPFVRIDLVRGKSAQYRKTLGDIVYKAMLDVINVPENDKNKVGRLVQLCRVRKCR
jgi:4-oxalocrotonate tautomerase